MMTSHRTSQQAVDDHFGSNAAYWRAVYERDDEDGLVYRQRQALALSIVGSLGLPDGARALELGSGAGTTAVELARLGLRVDAVDSAPEMVAQTAERARASDVADRVVAGAADVRALPFPSGQYDLVVSLGVFPWLTEPAAAVAEIARVLRPSGHALVSADNRIRLSELLDPLTGAPYRPLRTAAKNALRVLGLRDLPGARLAHRTSASTFADMFARAGLTVVDVRTSGFRRPTFLGRPLLPARVAGQWQTRLQRASVGQAPFVGRLGEHIVLLARKLDEGVTGCAS